MNCPEELRQRYREGRVIPFVGAGVSMSVTWETDGRHLRGPSWRELVDQAATMLGFENPELARIRGTDLQILEYFKCKKSDQTATLTQWFMKQMMAPDSALKKSPILRELSELSKCRLFYTTNYDDFLERAFEQLGRRCHVVAIESEMGGHRKDCEVVKFHGDLNHPDQIVLTESDYERRLSLSTELDHRLQSDILGNVMLFLGYGFRDPNVSYLFRLFTDRFHERAGSLKGDRAYIVVRDPSDFEEELFRARQIKVIGVSGADMTAPIVKLLREMRS